VPIDPKRSPAVAAFWRSACDATAELDRNADYAIWSFGDSQELSDHVLAEMLAGRNRATASLRWDYDADPSRLPKTGDAGVITDWSGTPRLVVVTRRVDILPYKDVDADFARAEGYLKDPLNAWREVHWAYFSRRCAELGRRPSLDMPVICERFEAVYPNANKTVR
jgi:uncharacterized protein YhfF